MRNCGIYSIRNNDAVKIRTRSNDNFRLKQHKNQVRYSRKRNIGLNYFLSITKSQQEALPKINRQ